MSASEPKSAPPAAPALQPYADTDRPRIRRRPFLQPNAQHEYQVTREDLPLCCPMPEMYLWNSHPRVYLAIEPSGWAKCSYCGAEYRLLGASPDEPLPEVQVS